MLTRVVKVRTPRTFNHWWQLAGVYVTLICTPPRLLGRLDGTQVSFAHDALHGTGRPDAEPSQDGEAGIGRDGGCGSLHHGDANEP